MSQRDDARVPLGGKVAGFTVLGLLVLLGAGVARRSTSTPVTGRREAPGSKASTSPTSAPRPRRRSCAASSRPGRRQPILVTYGDGRTQAVDPASAGVSIDYPASVVAAGGGTGWSLQRLWQVASGGGNHRAVVTVDEQKMQTALDALAQGIAKPPVDGTVAFRDGRPLVVPGRPGLVVDRSAARALLVQRFLHQGSQKLPTAALGSR